MTETPRYAPAGFQHLIAVSHTIRSDVEEDRYQPNVAYSPTDWTKPDTAADTRRLLAGFDPERGTCPTCYLVLAANGTCDCS